MLNLQDDVDDCINILSLLESGDNSNQDYGPTVGTSVNTDILKGRLCQFICCARFLEYWVPVQMSNLQLEQYCSLILSNRTALLSSSKSDPVGSLRDTLISTRKVRNNEIRYKLHELANIDKYVHRYCVVDSNIVP